MSELSIFVDESGENGTKSDYYLMTLVFHEQDSRIDGNIAAYESALAVRGLPDVPFHASPLMNRKDAYRGMDVPLRKRLLASFFVFARNVPVSYKTLSYRKREFDTDDRLFGRMRRDLIEYLFSQIEWLQGFDSVKVYYDDGQEFITDVLHAAIEYVLSRNVAVFKFAKPSDYRLAQVADLLCTVELAALKYDRSEQTETDLRFFGPRSAFRRNYLKKLRNKLLA